MIEIEQVAEETTMLENTVEMAADQTAALANADGITVSIVDNVNSSDASASTNNDSTVNNVKPNIKELISVYCIATLDNCPDSVLNHDYGDSIRRFIHCEHHLAENIASTELNHLSSKSTLNNKYVHTVAVTLQVKTTRLWESASKYVRKHLGLDNYWTRSNGTVVKLSRIHQKE